MKKFLAIPVLLIAAPFVQATQVSVTCTIASSTSNPPQSGSANSTCAGLSAPGGSTINFVTLDYKYDATFAFGVGAVTFSHVELAAALAGFNNPTAQTVTDTVRPFQSSITVNNPSLAIINALAAGSTIRMDWVNAGGSNATVSGQFRFTADYNNPVPEPATYGLLGASLIAMGYIGRRRRV